MEGSSTGFSTLNDAAVQYSTDAGFTAPITAGGLGHVNHAEGYDPGRTYWFRVAVRNDADLPNHSDTTILGTLGWGTTGSGPWSTVVGPVTTSALTGPIDTVIPGVVLNLDVTGSNGDFAAKWDDPSTGHLTIDDTAIQYTTDAGFTVNGPGSIATGWGHTNREKSTDPEKSYYWRVAIHNTSGLPSHASTGTAGPAFLGATGWGPWTVFGSPTKVSSGTIPGAGWQSQGENLCPNPSFEFDTDNDGIPDDCTYPYVGSFVSGSGRNPGGNPTDHLILGSRRVPEVLSDSADSPSFLENDSPSPVESLQTRRRPSQDFISDVTSAADESSSVSSDFFRLYRYRLRHCSSCLSVHKIRRTSRRSVRNGLVSSRVVQFRRHRIVLLFRRRCRHSDNGRERSRRQHDSSRKVHRRGTSRIHRDV